MNIAASNAATVQKGRRNVIAVMRIVVRYPQEVNADEANADSRSGVLEITMLLPSVLRIRTGRLKSKVKPGAKSNHEPGQKPPAKNN